MRWSRVRIAHDPPQKTLYFNLLEYFSSRFFYAKNLLTRDLRDLAFQPPHVTLQFQRGNSDQ
jgi:hypothetical protein